MSSPQIGQGPPGQAGMAAFREVKSIAESENDPTTTARTTSEMF
jgi:hypothetical protein